MITRNFVQLFIFVTLDFFRDSVSWMVADDCSEASGQMQNGLYMDQQKKAKAKRGERHFWLAEQNNQVCLFMSIFES